MFTVAVEDKQLDFATGDSMVVYRMAHAGYSLFSCAAGELLIYRGTFTFWLRLGHDGYEVVAQPSMVMVSTTSSKPTLTRLNTFPCPNR